MKYKMESAGLVAIAALVLTGCDEPRPRSAGSEGASTMGGMDRAHGGEEHAARGTVNSIDHAAGTINISHGPVESAGWPAMTMNFRLAERDAAEELEPGQRVEFRFTMEGGGTITAIAPSR